MEMKQIVIPKAVPHEGFQIRYQKIVELFERAFAQDFSRQRVFAIRDGRREEISNVRIVLNYNTRQGHSQWLEVKPRMGAWVMVDLSFEFEIGELQS